MISHSTTTDGIENFCALENSKLLRAQLPENLSNEQTPTSSRRVSEGGCRTYVLLGGAGTGKTTRLLALIGQARAELGAGPREVLFASFTRAAIGEAAGRAAKLWQVPQSELTEKGWFRTVHSVAYRQVQPQGKLLADTKDDFEWIARVMGVKVQSVSSDAGRLWSGDRRAASAMNLWDRSRLLVRPLSEMDKEARDLGTTVDNAAMFIERLEDAKRVDGRFDFTDILAQFVGIRFTPSKISRVPDQGDVPPVRIAIFDEWQDSSKLLDLCCRKIVNGETVERAYIAGDENQSIYGFGASSPDHLVQWSDEAHDVELQRQTYRCPAPVLALGQKILERSANYRHREILPAPHAGEVIQARSWNEVVAHIDPSVRTFILSRCRFTLDEIIENIDDMDAPLPYAHLRFAKGGELKTATKPMRAMGALLSLEAGEAVSGDDFACVIDLLPTKHGDVSLLPRGTKTRWKDSALVEKWNVVAPEDTTALGLNPVAFELWRAAVPGAKEFVASVHQYGLEGALNPQVFLSTIHGAKGLEADTVILCNESTKTIHDASKRSQLVADEERRVLYVGVTRARKKLVIYRNAQRCSLNGI